MKLTKEKFLALSEQMYNQMSETMDSDTQDFYTYESTLDKLLINLGSSLLEESLTQEVVSERKKKSPNQIWENKNSGKS